MPISEGGAGFHHHAPATAGHRLQRHPPDAPALLRGGCELQQPPGLLPPGCGCGLTQAQQQVAAGTRVDRRQSGSGGEELGFFERGGGLLQRHLRPTEHRLAARVSQQGAAEHQPTALQEQLAIAAMQPPALASGHGLQMTHERAAPQRRGCGLLRQVQQAAAEAIHLRPALPERSAAQGIRQCGTEMTPAIEAVDRSWVWGDPAAAAQRLEQLGFRLSGDVEQRGAVVDRQGGITAGAACGRAAAGSATDLQQGQRTGPAPLTQCRRQGAAGGAGTDHRHIQPGSCCVGHRCGSA
jgi:hypothetical protein